MPISLNEKNLKEDVWLFFAQWLTLLHGPNPEQAFKFIDGCSQKPGSYQLDVEGFRKFLQTFSGQPDEVYDFSDILLEGEDFENCKDDSSVHSYSNGGYFAMLDMPLKEKDRKSLKHNSHDLVVQFEFQPIENGLYKALLKLDHDTLIL